MDSQIELYTHNQIAYDKLCDMLSQSDRACVIQPTGTGKFVIIAKLVQDNPDKRFLLLGTNDFMYIDQMDNLEKIAPGFHPAENLQFKTYSAATVSARSKHVTLQYDYNPSGLSQITNIMQRRCSVSRAARSSPQRRRHNYICLLQTAEE